MKIRIKELVSSNWQLWKEVETTRQIYNKANVQLQVYCISINLDIVDRHICLILTYYAQNSYDSSGNCIFNTCIILLWQFHFEKLILVNEVQNSNY